MSTTRPLPTVIGPTENALRALLVQTLSGTAISSYEAWVTLNSAANAASAATASPEAASWRTAVAKGLAKPRAFVDEVVAGLQDAGLMEGSGALTARGEVELAAARAAVGHASSSVVADIPQTDQEVARRVLDTIRLNAERRLQAAER